MKDSDTAAKRGPRRARSGRIRYGFLPCLLALVASGPASAAEPIPDHDRIAALLDSHYPGLDRLYRDLHAHPEIAFEEHRTAALLASEMRKLGFEVTSGVGGTGVVAIYHNGAGPTVMIRTEMDGLPMEEKSGLPYASKAKQTIGGTPSFVAHSCGHDIHMAWWIGTAQALLAMKPRWSGTLMFVAQPAEETVSGAKAMLDDGLFARFGKPDYGFAAHVGPFAAGSIMIKEGILTSASDALRITFKGRGGHGSMPSATIDPVLMGSRFVNDVQSIISREKDAASFGVITVGSFQAGTVGNIIPDQAVLNLSLRSFTPEVRTTLNEGVARTARAVADMAGAPAPDIQYLSGTAANRNDPALTARLEPLMKAEFGERVAIVPAHVAGSSASEDYSQYVDAGVPSTFFAVGGYDPERLAGYKARGEAVPSNHSPYFAPEPQPAIRAGVEVLALAVLSVAPAAKAP